MKNVHRCKESNSARHRSVVRIEKCLETGVWFYEDADDVCIVAHCPFCGKELSK